MTIEKAAYAAWMIWAVSWYGAAFWSSRAVARPKRSLSDLHRMIASIGVGLLLWISSRPGGVGWTIPAASPLASLSRALWPEPAWVQWALFALTVASFAFCWWARVHMGRLWSGFTTVKAGHRIVESGPFAMVRHPIYAGVMGASVAMALIKLSPLAFLGAALVILGFAITARLEERFLREELGPSDYDAYRRRTPMLVPGLRLRAR